MTAPTDNSNRRIVVTGVGLVTPLGCGIEPFWEALIAGRSGVGPITLFDASRLPVRIAAEAKEWDIARCGLVPNDWRHHPRQTQFALSAGLDAFKNAGLDGTRIDPLRLGVYLGCGETFSDFELFARTAQSAAAGKVFDVAKFMRAAMEAPQIFEQQLDLNIPAAQLCRLVGAQGPSANCVAACATSSQSIGEAAAIIHRRDADIMLAGGAHSMIHPFGITGLHRLSALSTRNDDPLGASRPFDRLREGFVIGEGAGVLVLEAFEHAKQRDAPILCEITGYGNAHDANNLTDPHPDGRGAASCIKRALAEARLSPHEIDYVNAHGTGTKANDRVETKAIKEVFGGLAYNLPTSSTKSMIGHLTTAGGAVELIACIMSLRTGVVHPTINLECPDPDCDLDYVPNQPREVNCQHVLNNSFGFGGQNAALIVSQFGR